METVISPEVITSCENMRGTSTENPVAYVFSHPEAKRILRLVQAKEQLSFEDVRVELGLFSETVHRTIRRLAQFDLVRVRVAPGAKFHKHRIPVVVVPSRKTQEMCDILAELDQVLLKHPGSVGERTVKELSVLSS
jgi:hypothetical protein